MHQTQAINHGNFQVTRKNQKQKDMCQVLASKTLAPILHVLNAGKINKLVQKIVVSENQKN